MDHRLDIKMTTKRLIKFFGDLFRVADHFGVFDLNPLDPPLGEHALHGVELRGIGLDELIGFQIGTFAPLFGEHRLLRCDDFIEVAVHEDDPVACDLPADEVR